MGRFAEQDAILDAVVQAIADRAPDFDREIIEDLIEAVGPAELWCAILGPAVDQVMVRIGISAVNESRPSASPPPPNCNGWIGTNGELRHDPTNNGPCPVHPPESRAARTAGGSGEEGKEIFDEGIALIGGTCPHCGSDFVTTLESVIQGKMSQCPSCQHEFVPDTPGKSEPPPAKGGGE